MGITRLEVEAMLRTGRIRGVSGLSLDDRTPKKPNPRNYESDGKNGLKLRLMLFCSIHKKPLFAEQTFHITRKWRHDWVIPGPRPLAIEYEGLGFKKTGHTESDRYSDNTTKYNQSALAGITVLRYTYLTWEQAFTDLEKFYGYGNV